MDILLGVSCAISNQQDGRPSLESRPVQCVYCLTLAMKGEEREGRGKNKFAGLFVV